MYAVRVVLVAFLTAATMIVAALGFSIRDPSVPTPVRQTPRVETREVPVPVTTTPTATPTQPPWALTQAADALAPHTPTPTATPTATATAIWMVGGTTGEDATS